MRKLICCGEKMGNRKLMQNEGVQPSPTSPSARPANRDAGQHNINVAPAGFVNKVQPEGPVNVVPGKVEWRLSPRR